MAGLLMATAVLIAMGAYLARGLGRSRAARERQEKLAAAEGFSPGRPLRVTSFVEIDEAVDTWRCPCGGPLERIGEAGRTGPDGPVRVVRCACSICEEDVDLFFDLAGIRN